MKNKLICTILGILIGIAITIPVIMFADSLSFIDGQPYKFEGNPAVFVYSTNNGFRQLYSEKEYVDLYGGMDWNLIKMISIDGSRYGKYFNSLEQCEVEYEKLTKQNVNFSNTENTAQKCESQYNINKQKLTTEFKNISLPQMERLMQATTDNAYQQCKDNMIAISEKTFGNITTWSNAVLEQFTNDILPQFCDKSDVYNEYIEKFKNQEYAKIENQLQEEYQKCLNK